MKHTETVSGSLRILNLLLGNNETFFSLWQLFQKAKLVKKQKLLLIEKVIYHSLIGRSAKSFF